MWLLPFGDLKKIEVSSIDICLQHLFAASGLVTTFSHPALNERCANKNCDCGMSQSLKSVRTQNVKKQTFRGGVRGVNDFTLMALMLRNLHNLDEDLMLRCGEFGGRRKVPV